MLYGHCFPRAAPAFFPAILREREGAPALPKTPPAPPPKHLPITKVESPAEKKGWYPKALAGIALLALLGFLYCHFFAPAPPRPLLTPEEFEKAIDDVSLNIPELLNESEGSLLTRCVFAFRSPASRCPITAGSASWSSLPWRKPSWTRKTCAS